MAKIDDGRVEIKDEWGHNTIKNPVYKWKIHIVEHQLSVASEEAPPNFFICWMYKILLGWRVEILK